MTRVVATGRIGLAVSAALALASCGETQMPANTTVAGTVKSATRVRPGCYKIEVMFGGCGRPYYSIDVTSDTAELWSGSVGDMYIEGDDVRRIIGEHVTFRCYRASDAANRHCSQRWSSLVWNGHELIHAPAP